MTESAPHVLMRGVVSSTIKSANTRTGRASTRHMRKILRSASFGRARRPKGATRLRADDGDTPVKGGGGTRASSKYYESAADNEPVQASPRLAAIMSEQQAILSTLRDLIHCGRSGEELLCSDEFMQVVGRIGSVQSEQKQLLSPGSGEHVGAAEQKLLLRQSKQMLECIGVLTGDGSGSGGGSSSSSGGNNSSAASPPQQQSSGGGGGGFARTPTGPAPRSNGFDAPPTPPQQQQQQQPAASPQLIDFA